MNDMLHMLADAYGIEPGFISETGEQRETSDATRRALLEAIGVPANSEDEIARALSEAPLVLPEERLEPGTRAFRPDWLEGTRIWGVTCQLYGLTSERNWGIGDFEDLARLAEIAAAKGADFLGVNPLHALFPADPHRFSPYAPSSREFLNPMYIAPDKVPEYAQADRRVTELEGELQRLRDTELIDYEAVSLVKGKVLARLYGVFRHLPKDHARRRAFRDFRKSRGKALKRHCLFDALGQYFVQKGGHAAWSQWPEDYRDRRSKAVARFAKANKRLIKFYAWLQWLANDQLREAQQRACAAGMRVGLYLDLAVGVAPDGATTWIEPDVAIADAEIGCPPDALAAGGQQWGLAPFSPARLQQTKLAALRAVLNATMRHAGAVRIDHAMGLQRLFWIPKGRTAAEGAYIRYPRADMFKAVTKVSQKRNCLVIGEDLGTVPPGFRDILRETGLFGYRVFYFERGEGGRFKSPAEHDTDALICVSTHDLPTLQGWWGGLDIDWRLRLDLATPDDAAGQKEGRARDREALLQALDEAGLKPAHATADGPLDEQLTVALHSFLARSPCRLLAVQLDDALCVAEQANVPGTTIEHPNWRRKTPIRLEQIARDPHFNAVAAAVAAERPRP